MDLELARLVLLFIGGTTLGWALRGVWEITWELRSLDRNWHIYQASADRTLDDWDAHSRSTD